MHYGVAYVYGWRSNEEEGIPAIPLECLDLTVTYMLCVYKKKNKSRRKTF